MRQTFQIIPEPPIGLLTLYGRPCRQRAERGVDARAFGSTAECLVKPIPPENVFRMIRKGGRHEQSYRKMVAFQRRPGMRCEIVICLVERYHYCSGRQDHALLKNVEQILHRHHMVMRCQKAHLLLEISRRRTDKPGIPLRMRSGIVDPMIG